VDRRECGAGSGGGGGARVRFSGVGRVQWTVAEQDPWCGRRRRGNTGKWLTASALYEVERRRRRCRSAGSWRWTGRERARWLHCEEEDVRSIAGIVCANGKSRKTQNTAWMCPPYPIAAERHAACAQVHPAAGAAGLRRRPPDAKPANRCC